MEFLRYVAAIGYSMANHPVACVSWYGATAFCDYFGYRLPTESEWQAVADYDGSYLYGCGPTIDHDKANYSYGSLNYSNPLGLTDPPYTTPVDYYPSFGYGMNDMAGNLFDFTSTLSDNRYVIRGGAWNWPEGDKGVGHRERVDPDYRPYILGFRVCYVSPTNQVSSGDFILDNRYVLSISASGGGSVSEPGQGSYFYSGETIVPLVAMPDDHHHLVSWTGTAVDAGKVEDVNAISTTVTVDGDYTLQANFAIDRRTLILQSGEGGSVYKPGEGEFVYDYGTRVWLEAKAESGYRFKRWSGSLYGITNPYVWILKSDMNITALFEPIPYTRLQVRSTAGGSIVHPFDTTVDFIEGSEVEISVEPLDPNSFTFAGWKGSAVQAGLVKDPSALTTTVTIKKGTRLYASFLSLFNELHVNDDSIYDPGPGDLTISDPNENGTEEHPLDSIQEAIEVADEYATIFVHDGVYQECLDFLGKNLDVNGLAFSDMNALPVVDANGQGVVVTFTQGEDPNSRLSGFTLTGGGGIKAGAIFCDGASPRIDHCLIVGNRCYDPNADDPLLADPNSGVIYCHDSNAFFEQCTISGNYGGPEGAVFRFVDCNAILTNSLVWANAPRSVLVKNGNEPMIIYSTIEGGHLGLGNLDQDPNFVMEGHWIDPNEALLQEWLVDDPNLPVIDVDDPNGVWIHGDYHLASEAGRWNLELGDWLWDMWTSFAIDAGDPNTPVGVESQPHGDVVNQGAYGGTSQASKSENPLSL